jgi:hypothetical protein
MIEKYLGKNDESKLESGWADRNCVRKKKVFLVPSFDRYKNTSRSAEKNKSTFEEKFLFDNFAEIK